MDYYNNRFTRYNRLYHKRKNGCRFSGILQSSFDDIWLVDSLVATVFESLAADIDSQHHQT